MNIFVWAAAGGLLGWIGYAFLNYNAGRSSVVAALIGALGGVVGGKAVAPFFMTVAAGASVSMPALFVALAVSAAFLWVGILVYDRWGV